MRVLGIDPGVHVTGYGMVAIERGHLCPLAYGEVRTKKEALLSRSLVTIQEELDKVIRKNLPDTMVLETIFFGKNVRSLIIQGHARGVAMFTGASYQLPLFEYSPLEVKKAVVGYGRAEKHQVQTMVQYILKLKDLPPPDAADALAVAICHAHFLKKDPA